MSVNLSADRLAKLSRSEREELARLLEEKERRASELRIWSYFPDTGPLRRELYKKHMEFFEAGKKYRQRVVLAANRVGKTESLGLYETTLHAIGKYPAWWQGRRFNRPVRIWVCGETGETVRDILQRKLLGPVGAWGTGLIPKECITRKPNGEMHVTRAPGIADAADTIYINHSSGGRTELSFKSYKKGESSFPGVERDLVVLDEESPLEIKTECLMRTMTCDGMLMQLFTPLQGMSPAVVDALEGEDYTNLGKRGTGKYIVRAGWDDAPHLTEEVKEEMRKSIPAHQLLARSQGVPVLGSGQIYTTPDADLLVDAFSIPDHWPRGFGMDVGWNVTAAGWYTLDRASDILFRYSEHHMGETPPALHAEAIKARGVWVPGVIDPASKGRSQADGVQLVEKYRKLGLDLEFADNAVEAGILDVQERMQTGRFKIFRDSSPNFLREKRLYRRDENGKIVKKDDHHMDECRYFCRSGIARMRVPPTEEALRQRRRGYAPRSEQTAGWLLG